MLAASFPESFCLLLWEQGRAGNTRALGWGAAGERELEATLDLEGCRSPERSAEGVAHQEGLVRPGNTMVEMLYLGYECTLAYGLGGTWVAGRCCYCLYQGFLKFMWFYTVGLAVRLVLAQGENKYWLDWAVQILSSCFKSVLSDFPSCSVSVGQLMHLSGLWLVVQHLPALWQGECALTTQE